MSWVLRPPPEAESAAAEADSVPSETESVLEEGHGLTKEQNLFLVSSKPTGFERIRAHGEHISLQLERKGVLHQHIPPLAEAIFVSLLPKSVYRVDGRDT